MKEKSELLFEYRAKTTTVTLKEFTPEGIRADYNFEGDVTGRFNARNTATVHGLTKPDGTFEFEGRSVNMTRDGDVILVTFKGHGRNETPPMGGFESEDSYQTGSSKLSWLNTTKTHSEGTYNFATGESMTKAYKK